MTKYNSVEDKVKRTLKDLFSVHVRDQDTLDVYGISTLKEFATLADQLSHDLKTDISYREIRGNMTVSALVSLVTGKFEPATA